MLQRLHMRAGKIVDMNVVANARTVRRGVICPENLQGRTSSGRSAKRQRNQVRLRIVKLSDFAALVCSGGVEVTQGDITEVIRPVVCLERLLEKQFRHTIRVDRLPRDVLLDRNFRDFSVNRASGRENNLLHSRLESGVEQGKPAFYVIAEILSRIRDRFPNVRVSREVHDGIDLLQCPPQLKSIENISSNQLESRSQQLVARTKIVENDDVVSRSLQSSRGMTSYVSSAADDQNNQSSSPFRVTKAVDGRRLTLYTLHTPRVSSLPPRILKNLP